MAFRIIKYCIDCNVDISGTRKNKTRCKKCMKLLKRKNDKKHKELHDDRVRITKKLAKLIGVLLVSTTQVKYK